MPDLSEPRRDMIRWNAEAVLAGVPAAGTGFGLLRSIAEYEGVDLLDATLGDLAGTLRRDGGRWQIHLNRQDGVTRRRCTLARLLGHYFLHGDRADAFVIGGFTIGRDGPSAAEEWEAREFAAELLMPRSAIEGRLRCRQPAEADVRSLAERCGVSPLTMALRLGHLGYTEPAYP